MPSPVAHSPAVEVGTAERGDTIRCSRPRARRVSGKSGIPSRKEEVGLFPGADDCPGDIYVASEGGCRDGLFTSAAFDITVHGAMADSGKSSALVISSWKIAGAASLGGEKCRVWEFLRREREVALVEESDEGIRWKNGSQVCKMRGSGFNECGGSCRRKTHEALIATWQ